MNTILCIIIYYDIFSQLKVKNCQLYDNYIGIGLPTIIKESYCYDLNIDKFDNTYVYASYYNTDTIQVECVFMKITDDIVVIDNDDSVDDWNEGLFLYTIDENSFQISYMDENYNGVYRVVELDRVEQNKINVDYNLFNINLTDIITEKNIGHNDYWIYYNNEIIEKGVVLIEK
jgi:hypothetical protein